MTVEQQRSIHLDARIQSNASARNLLLARALFEICEEAELSGQSDESLRMPSIERHFPPEDDIHSAFNIRSHIPTDDDRIMWYYIYTQKTVAGGGNGPFPKYLAKAERRVHKVNDSSMHPVKSIGLNPEGLSEALKHTLKQLGVTVTADYVSGKSRGPIKRPGSK